MIIGHKNRNSNCFFNGYSGAKTANACHDELGMHPLLPISLPQAHIKEALASESITNTFDFSENSFKRERVDERPLDSD